MKPTMRAAAALVSGILVFMSLAWAWPPAAHAETYVGGMLGGAFPNRFSDVRDGQGARYSDLKLDASVVGGVKLGHYFSKADWLGVETELFATAPKMKPQSVPGTGPACPCTLTTSDPALRTFTWAVNAVVRYPGEKFQPYAGLGIGVFFADLRTANAQADNGVPGLNALAGARLFLTKELALFGEYKYTQASFDFGRAVSTGAGSTSLSGDYSANMFVVGLSAHFK
jgi:opacity protein-like surface antigen